MQKDGFLSTLVLTLMNGTVKKSQNMSIMKKPGISTQTFLCCILVMGASIPGVIGEEFVPSVSSHKILDDAVSALDKMNVDTTDLKSAYDSCDTDQITSKMDEIIGLLSKKGYNVTELKKAYDNKDYAKCGKLMDKIIGTLKDEGYTIDDITALLGTCDQETIKKTEEDVVQYLDNMSVDTAALKKAYNDKDEDMIRSLLMSYSYLFPKFT